jgi:hypothetical protein
VSHINRRGRRALQNYSRPALSNLSPFLENFIMAQRIVIAVAALLSAAFLTGTVFAADAKTLQQKLQRLGYEQGESVEKVQDYKLDGWNYIDDQHIMIYTGPSERFLVGLMGRCHDLSTAEDIGFSSTVSQLTKFDKLVVKGPGGMKQNCPITEIHRLNRVKKE